MSSKPASELAAEIARQMAGTHGDDALAEVTGLLAQAVVDRLGGAVISSAWPRYVTDAIGETTGGRSYIYQHLIPLSGYNSLMACWHLNGDRSVTLELRDWMGQPFWWGTFAQARAGGPAGPG